MFCSSVNLSPIDPQILREIGLILPNKIISRNPDWEKAVRHACTYMGAFRVNRFQGAALFVGNNKVLVSSQRSTSPCTDRMEMSFREVDLTQNKEVLITIEVGECLKELNGGVSVYTCGGSINRHPEIATSNDDKCLFVSVNSLGRLDFSIALLPEENPSLDDVHFFNGCYFNKEGELVALSLTNDEKSENRVLLAKTLVEQADALADLRNPSPEIIPMPNYATILPVLI